MTPRHPRAQELVQQGLFARLSTFSDLEERISLLPEIDQQAAFAAFAEAFIATRRLVMALEIWPVPLKPTFHKTPTEQDGFQGVFKTPSGHYMGYTTLFQDQRKSPKPKIFDPFFNWRGPMAHRLIITNVSELPNALNRQDGFYTIRGTDLDRLSAADFMVIQRWLQNGGIRMRHPSNPRWLEPVTEAINDYLADDDRLTLIMPPGLDLSRLCLNLVQQLGSHRTALIVTDSLAGIRKLIHHWECIVGWSTIACLPLCADNLPGGATDLPRFRPMDLDFHLAGSHDTVKHFLNWRFSGIRVIITTFSSVDLIADVVEGALDLALVLNAQHLVGKKAASDANLLDDSWLPIRTRICIAHKPHCFDITKRTPQGDPRSLWSLSDSALTGMIHHAITLDQAQKKRLLPRLTIRPFPVESADLETTRLFDSVLESEKPSHITAFYPAVKIIKTLISTIDEAEVSKKSAVQLRPVLGAQPAWERTGLIAADLPKKQTMIQLTTRALLYEDQTIPTSLVMVVNPLKSREDLPAIIAYLMDESGSAESVDLCIPLPGDIKEHQWDIEPLMVILQTLREIDPSFDNLCHQLAVSAGQQGCWELSALADWITPLDSGDEDNAWHDDIVQQVMELLHHPWDYHYGAFLTWSQQRGHGNVPTKDEENPELSAWAQSQRTLWRKGELGEAWATLLDRAGFIWDPDNFAWHKSLSDLMHFKGQTGHCRVPKKWDDDPELAKWVIAQRRLDQLGTLSDEYRQKLDQAGFDWNPDETEWQILFQQAVAYIKQNTHCAIPKKWEQNQPLADWANQQRLAQDKQTLSIAHKQQLDEIGFVWDLEQFHWNRLFAKLVKYRFQHSHCRVDKTDEQHQELAQWVDAQRRLNRTNKLSPERKTRLDDIGFIWDLQAAEWESMLVRFILFRLQNGHGNVPDRFDPLPELGKWAKAQRKAWQDDKIDPNYQQRLDGLGFIWDPKAYAWDGMLETLKQFHAYHGHCRVEKNDPDHAELATWVFQQRTLRLKNQLTDDQIGRLNRLGFNWDLQYAIWDGFYLALICYRRLTGQCQLPKELERCQLGRWIQQQRQLASKNKLPDQQKKMLEEIGFIFDPEQNYWLEMFSCLTQFKQETGHAAVPDRLPGRSALGAWAALQRRQHQMGVLSEERKNRLDEIGFSWDLQASYEADMINELIQFKKQQGHDNVPKTMPAWSALNLWLNRTRKLKKGGGLSPALEAKLTEIGFNWDEEEALWHEMFLVLKQYQLDHHHCHIPKTWRGHPKLARWVMAQRRDFEAGRLTPEQIAQFEQIGFVLDQQDSLWEEMYAALSDFRRRHGHGNVPEEYRENPNLAWWAGAQRKAFHNKSLPEEHVKRLNTLDFIWDPFRLQWNKMYDHLKAHKARYGHCIAPRDWPENPELAGWIQAQRIAGNNNALAKPYRTRLDKLGFEWDEQRVVAEEMFMELWLFRHQNGHFDVPLNWSKNPQLGLWVKFQRQSYQAGRLDPQRARRLEAMGFNWEIKEE
ncbi:MAG: helicase associated domain-containing protein [Magnetococcales bacterium]|nr:helicase associated domain-containing protein [Magnetococcales bacterium]